MFKIIFRLFVVLIVIALIAGTGNPLLARAHGKTCNWTAGSGIDFYWSNGDNWACTGGEGPPAGEDDVIISSNYGNAPMVIGNASAKTVTLSGVLKIGAGGGYLTVGSTWTNMGEATIQSQGTLVGNGEVTPTGTFHFYDSGTIIGNLTIDQFATASVGVSAVYMQGNVMNYGTLTSEENEGQFHMQGPRFTNYGTVSMEEFYFEKSGVQEVNGSGQWSGPGSIFVPTGTHLIARSNVNFGLQNIYFDDPLDVNTYKVTFKSPASVHGSIVGSPGGSVHTQGDGVSINLSNGTQFTPPLVVEDGVTHAYGTFSGTITVDLEGTLRVMAAPAGMIKAANDMTVTGTLDGEDSEVAFVLLGPKLTVNGNVSVAEINLQGTAQQTITGTGSLSLHHLSVEAPGGAWLNAPLTLDGRLTLHQNLYVGSSTLITLTASAITTGENSDKDIFGTVKRTGPFLKDEIYSFGNRNLTVAFTDVGSALPTAITMTLKQAPWKDLPGSINRSISLQTAGGSGWTGTLTLDYRDAELHGPPDFLQVWTRTSASSPWTKLPYSLADFNQNWINLQGLTHFSDWGLVIHSVFIPLVKR
jgi:cytoskeletal protein CcmA (bactofilin family)